MHQHGVAGLGRGLLLVGCTSADSVVAPDAVEGIRPGRRVDRSELVEEHPRRLDLSRQEPSRIHDVLIQNFRVLDALCEKAHAKPALYVHGVIRYALLEDGPNIVPSFT